MEAASAPRSLWSAKESYSVDQFYTRATDERGHSVYTRQIRMPPPIVEQIESLIISRQIPDYKSMGDFARDSFIHRLAWLRDNAHSPVVRDRMDEVIRRMHLEEITQRYTEELAFFSSLAERVHGLCDAALEAGDHGTLRHYLTRLREDVDPYREPFRTKILSIIELYESKL